MRSNVKQHDFNASYNLLTINGKQVTGGRKVAALFLLIPFFGFMVFVFFPIMFFGLLVLGLTIGLISLFAKA